MIKDILHIGDKLLLEKSMEVKSHEFNSKELKELINNLRDSMRETNGVGISAIQIGVKKRIALIEYYVDNPRYAEIGNCPLTVLINPEFSVVGDEISEYNEGCLSVPDTRGIVRRPKHIKYKYFDEAGQQIIGENDGFFARVMQHEIDHMDGILFTTRVDINKEQQ